MVKGNVVFVKVLLVLGTIVFLVASIIFSMRSFTGYVVSENVNPGLNWASFSLFALGIFCTFVYMKKFRNI